MRYLILTTIVMLTILSVNGQQVTDAEYFWGVDPGVGNGNAMFAFDGDFDNAAETIINNAIDVPAEGIHTLSIRALDQLNSWGPVFIVVVNVSEPLSEVREIRVSAAEYYFNDDPGAGNGTPMVAVNGGFSEAVEALKGGEIPSPVEEGVHVLWMRARDAENNWGPSFGVVVYMDTTITGFNATVSGPESICGGDDLLNNGYSAQVSPGSTYNWTVTNGEITAGQGTSEITVDWDSSGPHSVSLEQCIGTVCEEDELEITINPIYNEEDELTICFGEEVMLGGAMQSESGVYTDVYESIAGCDSTVQTVLTVLDEIVLSIEASATEVCVGESVTLAATGANEISWSNGLENGVEFEPTETATYEVTGSTNGCSESASIEVVVNQLPEVTIDESFPGVACIYTPTFELNFATPEGGSWSGNGVTDGSFSPEDAGIGEHTLTYSYTDLNDCSAEAQVTIMVDLCTSVDDRETQDAFVLYPNPANDVFWVELKGTDSQIQHIAVYDAVGQLVRLLSDPNGSVNRVSIDIAGFPSGVYLVAIDAGSGQFHQRLVITR